MTVLSMPGRKYQRRTAGPGRPRKYGEDLKKLQVHTPESTYEALYEMKEELNISLAELLTWLVQLAKGQIDKLELKAKVKHLADALMQEQKEKESILRDYERLLQDYEKLLLERNALREENRQLKQELAELRKQLKMSARERRAEDFKQGIHEIIERYGRDGRIKMLELLKRLGYSSDFKKHARELLDEWFVDEGSVMVSEELDLRVEKVYGLGELAWIVGRCTERVRYL